MPTVDAHDRYGDDGEGLYDPGGRGGKQAEQGNDDSVLIFDFLKRKRTLPSRRRLDVML